ncbi:MAG: FAD-dependent oxidoreductase [Bacillota bacterium]
MVNKTILVVGGGISGLTSALEAAEAGYEVFIVEKNPYLGGRVAQLNKYFPKICPPNCGLEINFKRIKNNPRVRFMTMAEVESISGKPGDFDVTVRLNPRYVTHECTGCGKCVEVCPIERANEFNYGLDKTKAIYLPHPFAFPMKYVIDMAVCDRCGKCVEACAYKAVDLGMEAKTVNLKVGAIVWATGWKPYDAEKISYYGFGRHQNVITNVMLERLAALTGPTGGKILRPSDGAAPKTIAFVQCAGSRDENHLAFCSQVCCLATLKQVGYVREQYPDAKIYIFYIDIRAMGKYEDMFAKVQKDENVVFVKGKVGEITAGENGSLILEVEDQSTGQVLFQPVDLVVLATGMEPSTRVGVVPGVARDQDGFVQSEGGVIGAGCVKKPMEVAQTVRDATGAALKAIQAMVGGGN